jgi:serine/threonine-protein kinase RsbW
MFKRVASVKRVESTVTAVDKSEYILLEVPADFKYLDTISSVLTTIIERLDEPPEEPDARFSIVLAVHEACTNIIEHAYHGNAGQIQVHIDLDSAGKKIVINLLDQGDPAEVENIKDKQPDFPRVKGYGLMLMRQLVDRVEYSREGDANRWRLEKFL